MSVKKEASKEIDDEISSNNLATLTIAVLKLLNQLEIKFPGKSNEQTRIMLQKVKNLLIFVNYTILLIVNLLFFYYLEFIVKIFVNVIVNFHCECKY